jgi:hypothetical protein
MRRRRFYFRWVGRVLASGLADQLFVFLFDEGCRYREVLVWLSVLEKQVEFEGRGNGEIVVHRLLCNSLRH